MTILGTLKYVDSKLATQQSTGSRVSPGSQMDSAYFDHSSCNLVACVRV